jgi:PqqD family protein of HPr-rel-A system
MMNSVGGFFVLHPELVFREEEDGAFLFNPRTNALHCLNKVGATICRMCDGKLAVDAICQRLHDEFEVEIEPEELKKDVEAFLGTMADLKLLQRRR